MAGPIKGPADFFLEGGWNADCSMCGRKFKASELIKHWQGMYRCVECFEVRHPQDFVRGVPDIQTPPWTQKHTDVYTGVCFPNGISAIAGTAVPGCAIAGYVHPAFNASVTV